MRNTVFKIQARHALLPSAIALFLSACGGGSDGSTETPATPGPTPAPTPTIALSLLAGNTNGVGNQDGPALTAARFGLGLGGMAVTSAGDVIIADSSNHQIRKLSANQEQVSTLAGSGNPVPPGATPNHADGNGFAARFNSPAAVAVDAAGNTYVADSANHVVRKISASGTVTTIAGLPGKCGNQDGGGGVATLCSPGSIAVDKAGTVYVSEFRISSNPIRKITAAGEVSTLVSKPSQYPRVGFISGSPSESYLPVLLATNSAGVLFGADPNDHVIRKYTAVGQASIVSGTPGPDAASTDGAASAALFGAFNAIAFDAADRLFVLDNYVFPSIRQIGSDGSTTTLVRAQSCNSNRAPGTLCTANQMVVKANGQFIVSEYGANAGTIHKYAQLRSYTPQGTSTVVAGAASGEGLADGQGEGARFDRPDAIALNPAGALYVRDTGNRTIRTVEPSGVVRTLGQAGGHCSAISGLGDELLQASTTPPAPLATDAAGGLYSINGARVLKTRDCQTVLLADLTAQLSQVNTGMPDHASGIAADSAGNVYVSTLKGGIFKIDTKGVVSLFAGSVGIPGHADGQGTAARFAVPGNLAIDATGNLYVVDGVSDGSYWGIGNVGPSIRKITPSGMVSTLAGNVAAPPGYADGSGAAAVFSVALPYGMTLRTSSLAVDTKGNVYVTDPVNSVIRKITADGQVSTPIGQAWRHGFAAGSLPGILNQPSGIAVRGSTLLVSVLNAVVQIQLP